jgi:hypothetical protein
MLLWKGSWISVLIEKCIGADCRRRRASESEVAIVVGTGLGNEAMVALILFLLPPRRCSAISTGCEAIHHCSKTDSC